MILWHCITKGKEGKNFFTLLLILSMTTVYFRHSQNSIYVTRKEFQK